MKITWTFSACLYFYWLYKIMTNILLNQGWIQWPIEKSVLLGKGLITYFLVMWIRIQDKKSLHLFRTIFQSLEEKKYFQICTLTLEIS